MKTKKQLIKDASLLVSTAATPAEIEKVLLFLANDIEALVRSEISQELFTLANKVSADKI
jgi:hypothetical protein